MRLEELNVENAKGLSDHEVKNLKERANQMYKASVAWSHQIRKQTVMVREPIPKNKLMECYDILLTEADSRNMVLATQEIDRKLARKRLRGIDVGELPPMVVKDSVVCLSGEFVVSPRTADVVEVRLDADEFGDQMFTQELEKRLMSDILDQVNKAVVVRRDNVGLDAPVIACYDLVLLPRLETVDEHDIDDLRKRLGDRLTKEDMEFVESRPIDPKEIKEIVNKIKGIEEDPDYSKKKPGMLVSDKVKDQIICLLKDEQKEIPTIDYISKPFANEHAARQADPKSFDDLRRKNNDLGSGIHVIWGIKGGKTKEQSIRFDASKFTPAQARKWLKEHNFKTVLEVATKTKKAMEKEDNPFLKNKPERVVGGIVYSANCVDAQGDFATAEDIYKAMKTWMIQSGGVMKFMHDGSPVNTPIVENMFVEEGIMKGGQKIPAGSWYLCAFIPESEEGLWEAVTSGDIAGFSMAGVAEVEGE